MTHPPSIFDYITSEAANFATEHITIYDNWPWNFRDHIQMSLSLKHGKFVKGNNDWLRPFKKVIEPILNLRYRAEDIELKQVNLFVENKNYRALSFLIKKYHDEVFVKEHDLDTFIDEAKEEEIDLGGVLVAEGEDMPIVMPLQFIAFCDQTDILGGPIGFKYYFSPNKLRSMAKKGWGDKENGATAEIDDLILLAEPEKESFGDSKTENRTTGKNIEIYIVYGSLPNSYLNDDDDFDTYSYQLQIVGFYADKNNKKQGVTLYRKEADSESLRFYTHKQVRGRALGIGGAEMLFNEQIWTNFLEINKMKMLEGASKNIIWTNDEAYAVRNNINELENNEVTFLDEGKSMGQVPTVPVNAITLFDKEINSWFQNAQLVGSAQDPLLGRQEFAGQTFRGQERLVQEGKSTHEYNRGKFAKFLEEVYRDIIIPKMVREIKKGKEFWASLTSEEMDWVMERFAESQANKIRTEQVLNGEIPQDKEVIVEKIKADFRKKGNRVLFKIIEDEFKNAEIKISIDVAGKQKDLGLMSDKLVNIFRFIFSNPQGFQQIMQIPGMSAAFNDILEFSGLSQVDFSGIAKLQQAQAMQMSQQQPEPLPA